MGGTVTGGSSHQGMAQAEPKGDDDWDDKEYKLGAVALPFGGEGLPGGAGLAGPTTQEVLEEWEASAERASQGERLVAGGRTADGETEGHRHRAPDRHGGSQDPGRHATNRVTAGRVARELGNRGSQGGTASRSDGLGEQVSLWQLTGREEPVACICKDAELARQLMTQDAISRGILQAKALRAQVGPQREPAMANMAQVDRNGDLSAVPTAAKREQALAWKKRLSTGAWRGAKQLAAVVVQPQVDVVAAAAARTQMINGLLC